jgi:hypothetical protein
MTTAVRTSDPTWRKINLKRCWGKRSWPDLRYYSGTCLNGLRRITKIIIIVGNRT